MATTLASNYLLTGIQQQHPVSIQPQRQHACHSWVCTWCWYWKANRPSAFR
jgi:hypothetical protein